MIELLKKVKRALSAWVLKAKVRREANIAFRYDRAQFMANAGALHLDRKAAACAEIVMGYHVIEKGLTMPRRRLGFGKGAVVHLVNLISSFEKRFGRDDPQVRHAVGVLRAYRELHRESPDAMPRLDAFLAAHSDIPAADEPHVTRGEFFAAKDAPLSASVRDARQVERQNVRAVFSVGVPSAVLTGLFDVANICVNILSAAHNDLVLAGMGIVMKLERLPNAVNVGICQGMLPIVAFNYSSGNHERMREVIRTARRAGLLVAALCIVVFELFAAPASRLFLSTSAGDAQTALVTVGYAALFLRIRCTASPMQFLNYHTSFCMQAMGNGKATLLHAFTREIVFYIPCMFLLDALFGELGLASALPVGETCGALFALWLLRRAIRSAEAA